MFISENKKKQDGFKRAAVIYLCISLFCLIFALIYDRFSHGVHSPHMTWLCAWPFVLGALPSVYFWKCKALLRPNKLSINIWNCGVAALTVSSLLRGIFEIAGTGSVYQQWLMLASFAMLLYALIAFIFQLSNKRTPLP